MPKKTDTTTPGYIAALLQPRPAKATDRRAWSIPVFGVWVPFFTTTNTEGQTHISAEALGAPLRLQREQDGTPRFSKTGRPVIRVAREQSEQVRIARDNTILGYLAYADTVRKAYPEQFKAQVEAAQKAGRPIAEKDASDLSEYLKLMAEAQAEAQKPAEADTLSAKELVPA